MWKLILCLTIFSFELYSLSPPSHRQTPQPLMIRSLGSSTVWHSPRISSDIRRAKPKPPTMSQSVVKDISVLEFATSTLLPKLQNLDSQGVFTLIDRNYGAMADRNEWTPYFVEDAETIFYFSYAKFFDFWDKVFHNADGASFGSVTVLDDSMFKIDFEYIRDGATVIGEANFFCAQKINGTWALCSWFVTLYQQS